MRRAAVSALLLVLTAGCGAHTGRRPLRQAENTGKRHAAATLKGITAEGLHIPWWTDNPAGPNLPPIRVMVADADHGSISLDVPGTPATLQGARAKLYEKGELAILLDAPAMQVDAGAQVVWAAGGVRIRTAGLQAGETISANRMVWYRKKHMLIATGNAEVHDRRRGHTPADTAGRQIIYNLVTKTMTIAS